MSFQRVPITGPGNFFFVLFRLLSSVCCCGRLKLIYKKKRTLLYWPWSTADKFVLVFTKPLANLNLQSFQMSSFCQEILFCDLFTKVLCLFGKKNLVALTLYLETDELGYYWVVATTTQNVSWKFGMRGQWWRFRKKDWKIILLK